MRKTRIFRQTLPNYYAQRNRTMSNCEDIDSQSKTYRLIPKEDLLRPGFYYFEILKNNRNYGIVGPQDFNQDKQHLAQLCADMAEGMMEMQTAMQNRK